MLSGVVPLLYVAMQALVEALPTIPTPSLNTELPLSFFDGMTRAYLLCSLIPPVVLTHTMPAVSTSPWTLLLTSLVRPSPTYPCARFVPRASLAALARTNASFRLIVRVTDYLHVHRYLRTLASSS